MDVGIIKPVKVEEEMKTSYLDYAMSVIVSRALPDVRDGLKPVHRRILYSMDEMGLRHNTAYKKSARVVGDVLGKYHPHGDVAVYDAMVRMAQSFSMRYVLIDGQGNFGSVDDDPPAAMRYTEVRMAAIAQEMLADIDKDTIGFVPNFDASLKEPSVLPARIPNLLLNGASGIAVGMATNIPPHNLKEIADAIIYLIDNPEGSVDDLCQIVHGPDFPTAGIIMGKEGIKNAYAFGHGRIVVRAKTHMEEMAHGGRIQVVVTELPYQINKAALVKRIAELVKEKKVEGISDLRDESDRQGMRIVIELKKDAHPQQTLNALCKYTAMQSAFSVNMLALVDGEPRVLTLKMMLQHYINFRKEVITRRTQFELARAKERAHILEGLRLALDRLDEVLSTIRASRTAETAKGNLKTGFGLSDAQAQAILDMQLRRLAALERKKIVDEYAEVLKNIAFLEDLLANPRKIFHVIKEDLQELKNKYGDGRRTQIIEEEGAEFAEEDLIPHQEVLITISSKGYIKRVPCDQYRPQHRGGKGIVGIITREADVVQHLLTADTHDTILLFTNRGRVCSLKCLDIPDASRQARGLPLVNLVSLDPSESITAVVTLRASDRANHLVMATAKGEVKKTTLSGFMAIRSGGIIAMDLEEGDELIGAKLVGEGDEIILVTQKGKALRFKEKDLRSASRTSGGVRGIRLEAKDRLLALGRVENGAYLLTVSTQGFGKLTPLTEYPVHGRGGGGVRTFKVTSKTGDVVAARIVQAHEEVIFVSTKGIVLRTPVSNISTIGRNTQGVHLMKLQEGQRVVTVTLLRGGMGPLWESEPKNST